MGPWARYWASLVDGGADHLLAVKDNQPLLRQELEEQLASRPVPSRSSSCFHQTEDQGGAPG